MKSTTRFPSATGFVVTRWTTVTRTALARLLHPLVDQHRTQDEGIRDVDTHPGGIDVETLADTIFELEQSLDCQGLELSPRGRAELIAEAYDAAAANGTSPDKRDIDRLVWMKAG